MKKKEEEEEGKVKVKSKDNPEDNKTDVLSLQIRCTKFSSKEKKRKKRSTV